MCYCQNHTDQQNKYIEINNANQQYKVYFSVGLVIGQFKIILTFRPRNSLPAVITR